MKKTRLFLLLSMSLLFSGCSQNSLSTSSSNHPGTIQTALETALKNVQVNYTLEGSLTIYYRTIGQQLDFNFLLKQTDTAWYKIGYDSYFEQFMELPIFKQDEMGVLKNLNYANQYSEQDFMQWIYLTNPFSLLKSDDFVYQDDGIYSIDLQSFSEKDQLQNFLAFSGNMHYYDSIRLTLQKNQFTSIHILSKPEINELGNTLQYEYQLYFKNIGTTSIQNIKAADQKDYPELKTKLDALKEGNFTICQEIVKGNYMNQTENFNNLPSYQKYDYYYDSHILLCEYNVQGTQIQKGYYSTTNSYMYPFTNENGTLEIGASEENTFADLKPIIGDISIDFFEKKDDYYSVLDSLYLSILAKAFYLDANVDYAFLINANEISLLLKEQVIYIFALFNLNNQIYTLRNTITDINSTDASQKVDLSNYFTKEGFVICDLFIGKWQGELRDNYTGEWLQDIYTLNFSKSGEITINDEVYSIIDYVESTNEGGTYTISGSLKCSFYYQHLPGQEECIVLTTDDLKYQIKFYKIEN